MACVLTFPEVQASQQLLEVSAGTRVLHGADGADGADHDREEGFEGKGDSLSDRADLQPRRRTAMLSPSSKTRTRTRSSARR